MHIFLIYGFVDVIIKLGVRCGFCDPRNKEKQIVKNKLPLVWGSWRLGFREVGSLTKKAVKSLIFHGFTA